MTNTILDCELTRALQDPAAGPDLHRALTAMCASSGRPYMAEYSSLRTAMLDSLHGAEGATVRDAIRDRSDMKLDRVETDIRTLEAGQKAADRVRENALRLLDSLPVGDDGRVRLLDSRYVDGSPDLPPQRVPTGTPPGQPIGPASFEAVMNAPLYSSRLARARQLAPQQYDGDTGAHSWQQADRAHCEAGLDLLGTMERSHQIAVADSRAQAIAGQLDQAFQRGGSPKERRRLMEKAAAPMLRMLES